MFGVKASASLTPPRSMPAVTYSARLSGVLSLVLGLASVALIQLAPVFLAESLVVLVMVGLALGAAAGLGLATGFAYLCTRIELGADGVRLSAPTWRLYPTLPVQRLAAGWRELRAVRHRTERYRVGLPRLEFEVDVYVVQTERGSIVLGGYYLPELETVLTDLAQRAECRWVEDGTIDLGLLPTLWRGAPDWPRARGQKVTTV